MNKNVSHQSQTILGREPDINPLTTTCKSLLFWHYFISHYSKTNFCRSMYSSIRSRLFTGRLSFFRPYYKHQYIFSIIVFNNLFFATSSFLLYYLTNVDIPMRNVVMEQKCFGQIASFK